MPGGVRHVPEKGALRDLWTSLLNVQGCVISRLFGSPALLARDDVGGIERRPVVLRGRRFVRAMAHLGLAQKICQGREVEAQSSSGQARLDLLKQPAVAVRI